MTSAARSAFDDAGSRETPSTGWYGVPADQAALGSVQVICSDKTGTLTQNRMTVTAIDIAAGRVQFAQRPDRTGPCLAVVGAAPHDPRVQPDLDLLLIAGALCNDAGEEMTTSKEDSWRREA